VKLNNCFAVAAVTKVTVGRRALLCHRWRTNWNQTFHLCPSWSPTGLKLLVGSWRPVTTHVAPLYLESLCISTRYIAVHWLKHLMAVWCSDNKRIYRSFRSF